jgi:hypothetical protein
MGLMIQPSEVVVNKVLPAIRARLAQILIEGYHLKQMEVARRLGVTQAAISHYHSRARGYDESMLEIFPEIEGFVLGLAADIARGLPRQAQVARLNEFCWELMMSESFCTYHRRIANLPDCNVCHEPTT